MNKIKNKRKMNKNKYDVIILGGGPGGVSAAGYLAKKGYSVCIVEAFEFPRFKVGESLLPYSMEVFIDLNFEKTLQKQFLQKNGAHFFDFRTEDEIKFDFSNSGIAKFPYSYEVERAKMDQLFLKHVVKSFGVKLYQPAQIINFIDKESCTEVHLKEDQTLEGTFIIDASGKNSVFGRQHLKAMPLESLNDLACFGHFKGLPRESGHNEGDIFIGILGEGAWMWSIPFKGETSSLGVVCSRKIFKDLEEGVNLISYFEHKYPKFSSYTHKSEPVSQLRFTSNYSFRRQKVHGKNWLLVGDSMGFLDPIFSTGVHVALYSGKLASEAIDNSIKKGQNLDAHYGKEYDEKIQLGFKRFSGLLEIFYDNNFLPNIKKTLERKHMRHSFTDLIAGGAWEDNNVLFRMGVI